MESHRPSLLRLLELGALPEAAVAEVLALAARPAPAIRLLAASRVAAVAQVLAAGA